jgi:hypothetical protein
METVWFSETLASLHGAKTQNNNIFILIEKIKCLIFQQKVLNFPSIKGKVW